MNEQLTSEFLDLELSLDSGGESIKQTSTDVALSLDLGEIEDEPSLNLNLNLDLFEAEPEKSKLTFQDSSDYLKYLLERTAKYNGKKAPDESNIKEFMSNLIKVTKASAEIAEVELSAEDTKELEQSSKAFKVYFKNITRNGADTLPDIIELLDDMKYPVRLLYMIPDLQQGLEQLIHSTYTSCLEQFKQYSLAVRMVNPALSMTGITITPIKEIYWSQDGEQEIICPQCGARSQFKMLRFTKPYAYVGSVLFDVQPYMCSSCGCTTSLSKESIDTLESALSTFLDNEFRLSEDVDKQKALELFLPPTTILTLVPEIKLQSWDLNEFQSTAVNIRSIYRNFNKSFLMQEMKEVLALSPETESIRKRLFIENGLNLLDNVGSRLDCLMGTLSQVPIIKQLRSLKKLLRTLDSQCVILNKILFSLDYLKGLTTTDTLAFSTVLDQLNSYLKTVFTFEKELTKDEVKQTTQSSRAFIYQQKTLIQLNTLRSKQTQLLNVFNRVKQALLNDPVPFMINANVFSIKTNVLDFLSFDELTEFLPKAFDALALTCWYQYKVNLFTSSLQRSKKTYQQFASVSELDSAFKQMPSSQYAGNLISCNTLYNLNLPALKKALRELEQSKAFYRFLYTVIKLYESNSTDKRFIDLVKQSILLIPQDIMEAAVSYTIDSFEQYCVLTSIGFKSEEVHEKLKQGTLPINVHALAVPSNLTIDEYIDQYQNLPIYFERVIFDAWAQAVIFAARYAEAYLESSLEVLHQELKSAYLDYIRSEVSFGTDLFDLFTSFKVEQLYTEVDCISILQPCKQYIDEGFQEFKLLTETVEPLQSSLLEVWGSDEVPQDTSRLFNQTDETHTCESIIRDVLNEIDPTALQNKQLTMYLLSELVKYSVGSLQLEGIKATLPEQMSDELLDCYILKQSKTQVSDDLFNLLNLTIEEVVNIVDTFLKQDFNLLQKADIDFYTEQKLKKLLEVQ